MAVVPVASATLCLLLEFDLAPVPHHSALPARDHAAAAARACAQTGLQPGEHVAARARIVADGALQAVQQEPFDAWGASEDQPVKLDFCYHLSGAAPKLCIRVLTDLRTCDGVTAVRLALHTLEVIESQVEAKLNAASFAQNQPVPNSCRRFCSLLHLILAVILDIILAPYRFLWKFLTCQNVEPNTPEGWLWYHCARTYQPADVVLFATGANMYNDWLSKVDVWRKEIGLHRGFFYLLNYSPFIAPGVVRNLEQLRSPSAKLEHALVTPGPPKLGPGLHVLHLLMSRTVMFNNYGRHLHGFRAVPTRFCWDWLNFPATMSCAFSICINGRLLCGIRGESSFVERGRGCISAAAEEATAAEEHRGFSEVQRLNQIIHYPKQGRNRFEVDGEEKAASPPPAGRHFVDLAN